jgi:4-hydroxybenzoate polyprenyltransferase
MKLIPYLQLMRLDKPIGFWLLYFPASWAVALAAPAADLFYLQGLMLVGAIITRAAGCIINDLTDRKLDQHVARTRERPLAAGRITRRSALILLAILLTLALGIALSLPHEVLVIALVALPMIVAYPWMKRITWWPQVFLGLTFNLSALMGWAATGTPLSTTAFLLYAAAALWTLGYDTIYAVQDIADDARIGIRSSARAIGARLKPFIAGCYGLMFALLVAVGALLHLIPYYYLGLAAAALHGAWQWRQLPPSPERAGALFRSNQTQGFLVLAACLLGRVG